MAFKTADDLLRIGCHAQEYNVPACSMREYANPKGGTNVADNPPYMMSYGLLGKILEKVKTAATPPKFTQDYLKTRLGFTSGSAMAFIPFAKRLGLLNQDGTPSDLYTRFRNPDAQLSGAAIAESMRRGYSDLFARNEYVYEMDENALHGLIIEATGLDNGSKVVTSITKTFLTMRDFADFQAAPADSPKASFDTSAETVRVHVAPQLPPNPQLGFSTTIYLNLPNTSDIAVFNAIFKSLRDNLLP